MSVTSHLKDLLTKMGGTPKNGDSTSVLIDKIEDVYASGSGGGSSASDLPLVVTIYADDAVDAEEDNAADVTLKLNKTFSEILRAHTDNRQIIFRFETVFLRATGSLLLDPMPNVTLVLHNNHSTRLEEDKALDEDGTVLILSEYVYNAYQGTSDDFGSNIINPDLAKITATNIGKVNGIYIILFSALNEGFFNVIARFECNDPDEYPSCIIFTNVLGK